MKPFVLILFATTLAHADLTPPSIVGAEAQRISLPFEASRIVSQPTDAGEEILTDSLLATQRGAIAAGDLDGDGRIDLVKSWPSPLAGAKQINVYLGGNSGQPQQLSAGSSNAIYARGMVLADANSDGNLDIISHTNTQTSVLLGRGDGTFSKALLSGAASPTTEQILSGDFNSDGRLDLILISTSRQSDLARTTVTLELGRGNGTFVPIQVVKVPTRLSAATLLRSDPKNLVGVVIAGGRASHMGKTGIFVLDIENSTLGKPILIYEGELPTAVTTIANGRGVDDILALTNEKILKIEVTAGMYSTFLQPLPKIDYRSTRADMLVGTFGKNGTTYLALLEQSGSSTIRVFELK